jgi:Carboxypeptidase regulatory-like domain/TonB dependent receptor/TonB-dependent Receptor Plug Domain
MQNRFLRTAIYLAMGASLAAALPQISMAASGDGSIVGRLTGTDNKPLADADVTARNPETGFTRTVKADAEGNYRFPFLPVGTYVVEAKRGGTTVGTVNKVTVGLGTATTANVTAGATIETIEVSGTRLAAAIDVRSTESATNVTREELERLPVERDILSAALLAPGLVKGDEDLADGLTVSFGGASVAENSVYINGLNVTDFYNRVGSSTVPYAFYKEFQIKTGGYSVEFGRTTGGVINAVTRSGTNEFDFGTEVAWEPSALQASATDRYLPDGTPNIIGSHDEYDRTTATVYASGPIVKDKLFFFALYEARDYQPVHTDDFGETFFDEKSDDGFWGAKIDWQVSDHHLLEFLGFSDQDDSETRVTDFASGEYQNTEFESSGGTNWSATYTGYLADNFTMKALYGQNEREASQLSANDIDCNRIRDRRTTVRDLSCTTTTTVSARTDTRDAARLDFEWSLGDHQVRFGLDREENTSEHLQHYPGPGQFLYEINTTAPGATLENGGIVPAGITAYVRARRNEVEGEFETINSAYYLEDNWSITPNLVLNGGVRVEGFDNKNSDGDSYIKIDDMIAPRVGFSWDIKGDNRTKLFANAGRYFLPVANVINIKQAGGFLDERTYYAFQGLENFQYNGQTYQRPILGAQIGAIDNSQGDGSVGDLSSEVDKDMDPVFQDEVILGFQSMIDERWSWGVRGIYRKLNNAIDDMNILSNGYSCGGEPVAVGFVMANPGEPLTVFTDTNCDGDNDSYVTIDTSRDGWASYSGDNGNGTYLGVTRGFPDPKRTYKAIELVLDRAWDNRWTLNASYTWSKSEGNAEGPVTSDFNFADAGRTEAFDTPWVNYGADGYLPNDRRHQVKLRGAYGLTDNWEFGASLTALSGRPMSALGVGNPFDGEVFQSFFVCTANCSAPIGQRTYEFMGRGGEGRTPWTYDLGLNVVYKQSFSVTDLRVKLSVFNVLNQERVVQVNERLQSSVGSINDQYGVGTGYQSPRYAMLTLNLDF